MATYHTQGATGGGAAPTVPSTGTDASGDLTAIRFGEFLCERQLISEEQLLEALGDHWSNGGTIGSAICRQGFLDREALEREASIYHSVDAVEI